jgi:hypothetical protein
MQNVHINEKWYKSVRQISRGATEVAIKIDVMMSEN